MNDHEGTDRPDLGAEVLRCGRSTDDLLEQVARGRAATLDEHQRGCAHCRAALSEAARLWAPVQALAAQGERPPPGLVEAVMSTVRALGRQQWHVVAAGAGGATRVAARGLLRIAERAAASTEGVHTVLGRVEDSPGAERQRVGMAGSRIVVDLAVVTVLGRSVPLVAARVRETVRAQLAVLTGATSTEVNIHVHDVAPRADPT